jgi:hypothetical protein
LFLLLQPKAHFVVVKKLSTISLCDSLANSSPEVVAFLDQTQRCILHQMFSVGSGMSRDLNQLRLLFRGEMHFHATNVRLQVSHVNAPTVIGDG